MHAGNQILLSRPNNTSMEPNPTHAKNQTPATAAMEPSPALILVEAYEPN